MTSVTAVFLVTLFAQAFAQEQVEAKTTIDKLTERALQVLSLNHADLDSSTLGKVAVAPQVFVVPPVAAQVQARPMQVLPSFAAEEKKKLDIPAIVPGKYFANKVNPAKPYKEPKPAYKTLMENDPAAKKLMAAYKENCYFKGCKTGVIDARSTSNQGFQPPAPPPAAAPVSAPAPAAGGGANPLKQKPAMLDETSEEGINIPAVALLSFFMGSVVTFAANRFGKSKIAEEPCLA